VKCLLDGKGCDAGELLAWSWAYIVTLIYVVRGAPANEGAGLRLLCQRHDGWACGDVLFLETGSEEKGKEAWVMVPNAEDRWLVDLMPKRKTRLGGKHPERTFSIRAEGGTSTR